MIESADLTYETRITGDSTNDIIADGCGLDMSKPMKDALFADVIIIDTLVTDRGVELDSRSQAATSGTGCRPSNGVCDGLDNDCSGAVDDDNTCACERAFHPLFSVCFSAFDWQTALLACATARGKLAMIETPD